MTYLAVVWHWWLSFFLGIGSVSLVAAVIIGYFVKVQRRKYPHLKE